MNSGWIRFFQRDSMRNKLVLLPLVTSGLLLVLLSLFGSFLSSEKQLLARIEKDHLAKVDASAQLFTKISRNHARIFSLLASTVDHIDEESIYETGKPMLYLIHSIQDHISELEKQHTFFDNEKRIVNTIKYIFEAYKNESISSVEMASVDLGLSSKFIIRSNKEYVDVNDRFLSLLSVTRKNTIELIKSSRRDFERKTTVFLIITVVSIVLLGFVSVGISNIISGKIRERFTLMTENLIAMEEAKRAAESANKTKSEFLANISHELRTPLHGILGFATRGLRKTATVPPARLYDYFAQIKQSGGVLLTLVNNLLDMAKLEAGKAAFTFEPVDLRVPLSSMKDEFDSLLSERDLTVRCVVPDEPVEAAVDLGKIVQVVRNLLSNAVKFSPRGGTIVLDLGRRGACAVVSLSDQGPGIPEDELDLIFDKFVQSSKTKTQAGGTGLGLSICREIIMAHGGRIWAENRRDGGAVFSFEIPQRRKGGVSAATEAVEEHGYAET